MKNYLYLKLSGKTCPSFPRGQKKNLILSKYYFGKTKITENQTFFNLVKKIEHSLANDSIPDF